MKVVLTEMEGCFDIEQHRRKDSVSSNLHIAKTSTPQKYAKHKTIDPELTI